MTFAGIWLQVHPSSVSSNSLPTFLRSTCPGTAFPLPECLDEIFHLFVTDFETTFSGEISSVTAESGFSDYIASHSFVRSQQVLHNVLIVRYFVIS
jgi:hypothetical protein